MKLVKENSSFLLTDKDLLEHGRFHLRSVYLLCQTISLAEGETVCYTEIVMLALKGLKEGFYTGSNFQRHQTQTKPINLSCIFYDFLCPFCLFSQIFIV